jgi:antitoxin CptB
MAAGTRTDLERRRLRWRARRGLLENDLLLTRFLDRHEHELDERQLAALGRLLELTDNDLLDLLLARREPDEHLGGTEVIELLSRLRAA